MKNEKKAVCIVSGGLDSITMLYKVIEMGYNPTVLTFNYGSNHSKKEIPMIKWHCKKLGVEHKIIRLPLNNLFSSSLLQGAEAIPEGHYSASNMKSTVIPFRNGIMLSVAVGYAENIGADKVFLGSHKGDRAQYPDCTVEFTKAMSEASQFGTYNKVQILSPFNELMKWDIVTEGLKLGVNYKKTWSCYKGLKKPCFRCGTCVERVESFVKNKLRDPLATEFEWKDAVEYMEKTIREFDQKQ